MLVCFFVFFKKFEVVYIQWDLPSLDLGGVSYGVGSAIVASLAIWCGFVSCSALGMQNSEPILCGLSVPTSCIKQNKISMWMERICMFLVRVWAFEAILPLEESEDWVCVMARVELGRNPN